jgi:hypothetical protein
MQETYSELDAATELDAIDGMDAFEDVEALDQYDTDLGADAADELVDDWDAGSYALADVGDAWDEADLWDVDALAEHSGDAFYESIENAFAESMDATDEDEFMARVRGNLQLHGTLYLQPVGRRGLPDRRRRRQPPPPPPPPGPRSLWRQLGLQALPAAERVVQAGAATAGGALGGTLGRQAGGALGGIFGPAGRAIGGAAGGFLGGLGGRALGGWAGRRLTEWASPRIRRWLQDGMDAMDAFADLAADNLFAEEDFDEFAPMVAGLAGRYVVRAAGAQGSTQSRQLGRQVMRATRHAAQIVVGRHGRQAMRTVPRLVRGALREAVVQGGSPRSIPGRIVRRARQVTTRPAAVRRLSRPSPAARRIRAVAGLPAGRRLPARVAPPAARGRTMVVDGPIEILVQR